MDRPNDVVDFLMDWLKEDGEYRGYFEIGERDAIELAKYVAYLEKRVKYLQLFFDNP